MSLDTTEGASSGRRTSTACIRLSLTDTAKWRQTHWPESSSSLEKGWRNEGTTPIHGSAAHGPHAQGSRLHIVVLASNEYEGVQTLETSARTGLPRQMGRPAGPHAPDNLHSKIGGQAMRWLSGSGTTHERSTESGACFAGIGSCYGGGCKHG